MDINVVFFPETKIAYLVHKGSPSQIIETVNLFKAWRIASGYSPIATSATYGIPFSEPITTPENEFEWHVCGAVDEDIPENKFGVVNGFIPSGLCAVIRHIGPQRGIDKTISAVYKQWMPNNNYWPRNFPCFFHYVKMLHQVSESELTTDIYIPIEVID